MSAEGRDGGDAPSSRVERRRGSEPVAGVVERHFQTFLISVITTAVLFTAGYIFTDNREKGVASAQLQALTSMVIEMRGEIRAMQNNYTTKEETKDIEMRLRSLERGTAK